MPGYPGANKGKITNRPTCGGKKKAGLAPSIGVPINIMIGPGYKTRPPNCCPTWGVPCSPPYVIEHQRPVQSTRARYAM